MNHNDAQTMARVIYFLSLLKLINQSTYDKMIDDLTVRSLRSQLKREV